MNHPRQASNMNNDYNYDIYVAFGHRPLEGGGPRHWLLVLAPSNVPDGDKL